MRARFFYLRSFTTEAAAARQVGSVPERCAELALASPSTAAAAAGEPAKDKNKCNIAAVCTQITWNSENKPN